MFKKFAVLLVAEHRRLRLCNSLIRNQSLVRLPEAVILLRAQKRPCYGFRVNKVNKINTESLKFGFHDVLLRMPLNV